MRKETFALVLTAGTFFGCLENRNATGPVTDDKAQNQLTTSARVDDGTSVFDFHGERQTDGGASVEKFADCPINAVLTGFGGRVASGDFTNFRAYCRVVNPDGSLGPETQVNSGSTGIEKEVKAVDGWVVQNVGGRVDGNTLTRAVIKECRWLPDSRRVDPSSCRIRSADADYATELSYGADNIFFPANLPFAVLTGAGMTAGPEALRAIRITVGYLKTVLYVPNLSAEYSSSLRTSGYEKTTTFSISGGLGDADLYVGKGYMPTLDHYDCRPYTGSNNESCSFDRLSTDQGPVTYYVLVHPYQPFAGVTLKGEYFH